MSNRLLRSVDLDHVLDRVDHIYIMFVGFVFPCTSINKIKWAPVVVLHANTNIVPFFLWGTDKQSFFPDICYYILYSQRKKQAKDYEKKMLSWPCCTSETQSYKSTYQDRATRSWDWQSYYSTRCQREHSLQLKELHLKFKKKLREKLRLSWEAKPGYTSFTIRSLLPPSKKKAQS